MSIFGTVAFEGDFGHCLREFPQRHQRAVEDVTDTMTLGLAWMQEHGVPCEARDLLRFAELVLERRATRDLD